MTTASLPVQVLLVQVPVRVLPVSLQALSVKVFLSSVAVPEPSVPMSILQELISIAARVPINQSCYTTVTVSIDFGGINPPEMYILLNEYSPTLRPKGAQTPSN